jgi:hypothetical protein
MAPAGAPESVVALKTPLLAMTLIFLRSLVKVIRQEKIHEN